MKRFTMRGLILVISVPAAIGTAEVGCLIARFAPVLLIGAEILPGKITLRGDAKRHRMRRACDASAASALERYGPSHRLAGAGQLTGARRAPLESSDVPAQASRMARSAPKRGLARYPGGF